MGWLSAEDDLPPAPARVLIAGTAGSGKSTLARRVATALELPYFEIDALYHGSDWTPRPQFGAEVADWARRPQWVTEWQYGAVRELLADRAELLVWLDLRKRLVMRRLITRTVLRRMRRAELWNGNREPPLRTFLSDGDHIIRWAWRTHGDSLPRVTECLARRPDLPAVRLGTRAEVERWVRGPLAHAAAAREAGVRPRAAGGNGADSVSNPPIAAP
jgi:adenylate kinase family enzyme